MIRSVRAFAPSVTGLMLFAATGCFFAGDGGGLEPVELLPSTEVGTRWVKLAWTPSADPDFLEYQVYRGYDPSFDEDLSELIYTGTDPDVTRLTDEGEAEFGGLDPGETYYYRVFVVDVQGRRTGSNILSIATREWEVDEFDVEYDLERVADIAGEAEVRGIAASPECLWIVTLYPQGDYYDNDLTRLTCRDPETGETVRRFDYEDEYIEPNGIAWTGSALWINYCNQLGCDTARLKRIDPMTGAVDKTLIADNGTHDLAWDGEHLLLANHWNQIQVLDPVTGAVIERLDVPFDYSTTRGVAARPGEIWVSSQANDQLVVLDPEGNHIGLVDGAPLDDDWTYAWDLHLDFSGDDLILVSDSHVTTFSISTR